MPAGSWQRWRRRRHCLLLTSIDMSFGPNTACEWVSTCVCVKGLWFCIKANYAFYYCSLCSYENIPKLLPLLFAQRGFWYWESCFQASPWLGSHIGKLITKNVRPAAFKQSKDSHPAWGVDNSRSTPSPHSTPMPLWPTYMCTYMFAWLVYAENHAGVQTHPHIDFVWCLGQSLRTRSDQDMPRVATPRRNSRIHININISINNNIITSPTWMEAFVSIYIVPHLFNARYFKIFKVCKCQRNTHCSHREVRFNKSWRSNWNTYCKLGHCRHRVSLLNQIGILVVWMRCPIGKLK